MMKRQLSAAQASRPAKRATKEPTFRLSDLKNSIRKYEAKNGPINDRFDIPFGRQS